VEEKVTAANLGKSPQFLLELHVGRVEVLHEAEERKFVEKDLRQIHQEVLATVRHPAYTTDN